MMTELIIDFESRSHVKPKDVGTYNYAYHPTTEFLFLNYSFGFDVIKTWLIYLGEAMPDELRAGLADPDLPIVAFNSAFERHAFGRLGYKIGAERFTLDPQVGGRYLSLPANLEDQGTILGLGYVGALKSAVHGGQLIKLFCELETKKKKGHEPVSYYNDWNSHPKEWAEFIEYGRQDVVAERELLRRMRMLEALPLPPFEQRLWLFDQAVNDRGVPVDRVFVQKMYKLALRAKEAAQDAQNAITGLENSNSVTQALPWLKARGYPFSTLRKETVDSVLKDPDMKDRLAPEAREVLTKRREASSTTYTKLPAILNRVSPDGRLRGMFQFMGSARCGRWSGSAVQLHNMARPGNVGRVVKDGIEIEAGYDFEDPDVVNEARAMVNAEDYEGIKLKYKSVLLVVKNLIRTVFAAEAT